MNFNIFKTDFFTPYKAEIIVLLFFSMISLTGLALENVIITLLPVALLVSYLFFLNIKLGFYITAFIVPFSINVKYISVGISVNTPLDPFLFLLALSTIYKLLTKGVNRKILTHPLSILIVVFCCLLVSSSIYSSRPLISIRIILQTLTYIIPAYWGVIILSQEDPLFIKRVLKLVLFSFGIICFINFFRHSNYNFGRSYSWFIANPFYSDHTIYATMASFMIPIAFIFSVWYFRRNTFLFYYNLFLLLCCFSGLILSYSRAAMIGVLIAFCFYFYIRLKISWWVIILFFCSIVIFVILDREQLAMSVKRNRADSKTMKTNLADQVKSISNVSSDVSNLERLNRWNSALRMIKEHPYTGFGYGMYQFEYFPYQKASEMTQISVRNPQPVYHAGTGGTAHSEYLLLSSENGIFTGLIYVCLLITSVYYSIKNIALIPSSNQNYYLSFAIVMGITTYIVHGFFNNFLDTSKICFIFFAFLASITSINITLNNSKNTDIKHI